MIVGIDHGYYAIKTKHVSFPSGIIKYDYERIRCRMFCSIGESIMSAVQGDRRW